VWSPNREVKGICGTWVSEKTLEAEARLPGILLLGYWVNKGLGIKNHSPLPQPALALTMVIMVMVVVPMIFARDDVAEPVESALIGVVPVARDDVAELIVNTIVGVVPVARDDIAESVVGTTVGVVPVPG
jgi:hypothetical protein